MTHKTTVEGSGPTRKITIERTYKGRVEDIWELWTTKEGIESWWGPGGFKVEVRKLDLRVGGELHYAMIAVALEMVEYMKSQGMPTSHDARVKYTEIKPKTRLAYQNLVDFVPGVAAYHVGTVVELKEISGGVQLKLTLDAMHDEEWTQRAVMGWEAELGKLADALAR